MKHYHLFHKKLRFPQSPAAVYLLCFLIFFADSCKKDGVNGTSDVLGAYQPIEQRGGGSVSITDYGLPPNDITVIDGMMCFTSIQEVNRILDYLDLTSADNQTNLAILNALGYTGFESAGAPKKPVLFLFDQYFNFPSLRQKLENWKALEDQTGQDFSAEKNKLPLWEPVLGSIVNQDNEVRIGNLIYKYIDDNRTVVFRAGDSALLNLVRSTEDPFSIQNQFNFFKIDCRKKEDLALYDKIEAASLIDDCLFEIEWSNSGSQFLFQSIGYFPPVGNVVWRIIDGYGNVIASQNGSTTFSYLIPADVTYPLAVSIKSPGCEPYQVLFAESTQNNSYNCDLFDFSYEYDTSDPFKLNFTIPPYTPVANWVLGDGTILATPATGNTPLVFSHTYPESGDYTVCATVQPSHCNKTVCKELSDVNCGQKSDFKIVREVRYSFFLDRKATYEFGLKNPLFGKSRIHAELTNSNLFNGVWQLSQVGKMEIKWHSSPGPFYVRYFTQDCEEKVHVATKSAFDVSELSLSGKINKNSKMKIIDARVDFSIEDPISSFFVTSSL